LFRPVVATFASFVAIVAAMLPMLSMPDRSEERTAVRFEPRWRYVVALVGEHVAVSFDVVNASDHPIRVTDVEGKWGTLRVDTPEGESIPASQGRRGLSAPIAVAVGAHITLVDTFNPDLHCEPGTSEECFVRAWIDDSTEPIEAGIHWRRHWLQAVRGDSAELHDLGELPAGAAVERRFFLEAEDLGRFDVIHVGLDGSSAFGPLGSAVEVRGRDVTLPGATRTTYEVTVRFAAAGLPCGEHFFGIRAALRDARVSAIPFSLHAKVVPRFELFIDGKPATEAASLGAIRKIGSVARIEVRSRDREIPVHVSSARVGSKDGSAQFTVSVGSWVDGTTILDVGLAEIPKSRGYRRDLVLATGDLVFATDDPSAPEWHLKLSGLWVAGPATTDDR
jgi:hypothetical protein